MTRRLHTRAAGVLALTCLLAARPAVAQRVEENAIAGAEDAFGSNSGSEALGLYNPFDVRGFSPIDAGNVRVAGIYIDRQADLSPRLVAGNRIRVGPSAIAYAFPAPSGVVDYELRTPGGARRLSAVAQVNSFAGHVIEVDAALPLLDDRLGVGGGLSVSRSEYASGNNADVANAAAIAHWRPATSAELTLFWSRARLADEDIYPIILGDGRATPPRLERRRFLGQPWADVETERFNTGAVGQVAIAGVAVRAGVFRSVTDVQEGHSVFLQAAELGAPAARTISAYPGRWGASTSGEIGAARAFAAGGVEHRLLLVVRGRSQERRFGGAELLALRPAPFGTPDYVPRPEFTHAAQSEDRVRQGSAGLDYRVRVGSVGQLNAGLQKVDYAKQVHAATGPTPATHEAPWLLNAAGTISLVPWLTLYGTYADGLEESNVAPATAVNRDEAPPAIRTRQVDVGSRLRLRGLTLIAGAFEIERPYFDVDGAGVFRRLGAVRHRGLEGSLSGSPTDGLTVVAGATLLDARLTGGDVAAGSIGARPVGVPDRKLLVSADWRPSSSAVSVDVAVKQTGSAAGDVANRVRVAPYATVDGGVRYRFALGGAPAVLRLQATNLLNGYGWEVLGNNAFIYAQSRQLLARLAVDF